MSIVEHWRDRHPRHGGSGRLLLYIILLIAVILVIARGESAIESFARIFMGSGEDRTTEEAGP
ncbi:MAG: hypothetical protein ACQETZ_08215 [Candidatus Fermentibacterota bacterium]